ncbi:MAG: RodZ domain-containing protein [Pseudomonadales bacterium]
MSGTPEEIAVTETRETPGSRLAQAREAQGLTAKAVADELNLPRNYIMWIEEEAYEKLPSMVFCRGYIRAYAKVVKEDGEALVAMLTGDQQGTGSKGNLKTVTKIEAQVKVGDPVMKWPTILIVIGIAAAVFWWWQTQYGLNESVAVVDEPVAVETADGNELVLPSLNDAQPSDVVDVALSSTAVTEDAPVAPLAEEVSDSQLKSNVDNAAPAVEVPAAVSTGGSVELPLSLEDVQPIIEEAGTEQLAQVVAAIEPAAQALPEVVEDVAPIVTPAITALDVRFSDECWVTVRDSTGKTLFNGLKVAGETLSITGQEPLRVSIGRVDSVVQLSYAGRAIDLQQVTRNNIANFNLPL